MPSKIIIIQISHWIFHNYKIARSIAAQSVENLKQTFKPNTTIHVIYIHKESPNRKKIVFCWIHNDTKTVYSIQTHNYITFLFSWGRVARIPWTAWPCYHVNFFISMHMSRAHFVNIYWLYNDYRTCISSPVASNLILSDFQSLNYAYSDIVTHVFSEFLEVSTSDVNFHWFYI